MTPIEIVRQALADKGSFKRNARRLKELPPDLDATQWLVLRYQTSQMEAWQAAFLLGCVGHEVGYDTAREILLGNFRQSSECYAGEAMYFIRGTDAYEDLRSIMLGHPQFHVRQGAACGLACFRSPDVIADLLLAFQEHKLWPKDVARKIAECHPSDEQLLPLLRSEDERAQKLGLHIVDYMMIARRERLGSGNELKQEVARLLETPAFRPKRKYMRQLDQWSNDSRHP